ncbi:MAG: hypothetical protein ACK42H_12950 [Planctomycetota bacterium]|jgi:hypothetical protein
MTIEGIPDGWELVRVGKPFINERYISLSGKVTNCVCIPSGEAYAIVRKIEKPKRYRPFNDPAEAESLLGEVLRLKVDHKNKGIFIGITSLGFQIGLSHWKPKEAFDCFERLDGTPFGIEVTE